MDRRMLFVFLLVLFFCVGFVSANEVDNSTSIAQTETVNMDDFHEESTVLQAEDNEYDPNLGSMDNSSQEVLGSESRDVIVVNNWEELQYYCSLTDKDYTLKLKENTNFYPSSARDSSQQIKIKNNVKIIGSEGSWFGDSTPKPMHLNFLAIVVETDVRVGLTLENVTFKWIEAGGSTQLPDGMFVKIGGKRNSIIRNCQFMEITTTVGHSCVVHLNKGTATLDNCSFINCHTNYGVLSVYGSSPDMTVKNCYFEGNYAKTEPGCINNCGKLTVYNTTFYKNRAGSWAGAIHTHSGASTTIYDSNFTDNLAGWNGGALYTYSHLNVYNTVFIGNNCTTDNGGGAIGACQYGSDPHIYIENCLFKDNENKCWAQDSLSDGTGRGGAISIMDKGSLEVRNSTFISNSAAQGTAICAKAVGGYGSPDVIIVNNSFINHTRSGDVLQISIWDTTIWNVTDNYYYGNSIVFSNLTLTKLDEGKEQATLQITNALSHPTWYDDDILDKTLYDIYVNDEYIKTVNSTVFDIDFGDLDVCDVYAVPTISNRKTNTVTVASTRDYIFVSKDNGNDSNSGVSRDSPVYTIAKALQLARNCQNIILLDGDYSETLTVDYDVTIKGEGNATLTNATSFVSNNNLTLKNLKINEINGNFIKNNANLDIERCIITNNNAIFVENSGFVRIHDSVLLNNTQLVHGNNADLEFNWWGNNPGNVNNYITLNISSDKSGLENNKKTNVYVGFYLNGKTKYTNLPNIDFDVSTVNGTSNRDIINTGSGVVYTLTAFGDGVLTVNYNDFTLNRTFDFVKSDPTVSLDVTDIMFGEDLTVTVSTPKDAEGNLTVTVGNITQSEIIESSKVVFTFSGLKADNYIVSVIYSGDKKYQSKTLQTNAEVKRYDSATVLEIGEIVAGRDLLITVKTTDSSTGNVTLFINDENQTLILVNSSANYTIGSISRGDYLIRAVYNGDDKYSPSISSRFIEVDNLNATMDISIDDITFGEEALIRITLNDDATGIVTATVDGISNSSSLINGKAEIILSGLEAGFKDVSVFYTGDNTYFNLTGMSNFTISKANLTFNISADDIMIGDIAEIVINVAPKTKGTFTIGGTVISIPMSGEITYTISGLEIGDYSYEAVYNGNDYYTVSKNISFSVCEYDSPQWPNSGNKPENTQKSDYETTTNGEVAFIIPFGETIVGDIVIDSVGNIYLTTDSGVYCYNQTSLLWNFTSTTFEGSFSGSVIGRDVIIVPKSGDTLYFINQTTGEKYSSNIYQGSSLFAPVIDDDANLYISSELQVESNDYKLVIVPFNLWKNGGDPTLISLGNSQPLFTPTVSDNIIVVLCDNKLRIVDKSSLKTISNKAGNYTNVRPIIGEGDIIYCILSSNIVAYSRDGVQLWKTKVTDNPGNVLALDSEQGLYHVNSKGTLYRYDLINGKESQVCDLNVTTGILIGIDNNLYFGSGNTFYAIENNGKVIWKTELNSNISGNPVMDKAGLIYVTTDDGVVALTNAPLKDPNITISCPDIYCGSDANITVTIDNQCIDDMIITFNNETFKANGTFTEIVPNLSAGIYTINVYYAGDARFLSQNKYHSFEVKKHPHDLFITAQNSNHKVLINVTAVDGVDKVELDINGTIAAVDLINGKGYLELTNLSAGNYRIIASIVDDYYCGVNTTDLTVVSYMTQIRFISIDGDNMELVGVLTDVKSNPLSNKTISYTLNGDEFNTTTDDNGEFKLYVINNCVVSVVFNDDGAAMASSETITLKNIFPVKLATQIIAQNPFTRTAVDYKAGERGYMFYFTLKDENGKVLPNKKVKIGIDGKIYTVTTDKDGKAGQMINMPSENSYTYALCFLGDEEYEASFAVSRLIVTKKPITITPAKTSYTFTSSAKTKTVTATLKSSNSYIPKGKQVTLTIAGKTFKATIGEKGQISFNIGSITKKGTYNVAIKFAGTVTYNAAASKNIKIVIK